MRVKAKSSSSPPTVNLLLSDMVAAFCLVIAHHCHDYNSGKPYRLGNYQALIAQKGTMQGFIVMDYTKRYHEGRAYLAKMLSEGKLQYKYHVIDNGGDQKAS
jgi:NADPH-dependent curcumin reductase CurA